ncbi:MAG TPA: 1,4-alpha-glucan branching protein domain-containing protein [Solirubrobacteraceae bacterium]
MSADSIAAAASAAGRGEGALAIVLHTHMPYVEGFGTWPFGEEWLWEAMVGSYLPLLEVLDQGAPLTLSLTPVLCDQLEAPGAMERFYEFVRNVRRWTHAEDAAGLRAGGEDRLALELERAWDEYERALASLDKRGGNMLSAFSKHAQWTSSATHAVLPLLASDACTTLQLASGIASHRRRFGEGWRGGFWLPECAYEPWLGPLLESAGVAAVCVELTARYGLGAPEHLHPVETEAGVVLVPIDRETIARVWSPEGYPSAGVYRDYHHHTIHHHKPWSNDGSPYDHARACALAAEHAADFVAHAKARLAHGGLAVCALDTELLGHWWYEGVHWLGEVVRECERQGVRLVRLDDALAEIEPVKAPADYSGWPASSWGEGGDLSTWSAPNVAELTFAARAAELELLADRHAAGVAATRELLALQASDWAFMISRELAGPYPRARFDGHLAAFAAARADRAGAQPPRNLAVDADLGALLSA